ncbi:hypothetical protein AAHK20_13460 [Trinickia sp. YCB016]
MLTACVTAYQPHGATGGYTDRRIDDETYYVKFQGNGYTSRELVQRYFLFRCAELTELSGFKYFVILPPAASLSSAPHYDDSVHMASIDRNMLHKTHAAPIFIYTGGGGGATRWRYEGTIRMFNDGATMHARIIGWDAQELLDALGAYVQSSGKSPAVVPSAWVFDPGHEKMRYLDVFPTSTHAATPPAPAAAASGAIVDAPTHGTHADAVAVPDSGAAAALAQ